MVSEWTESTLENLSSAVSYGYTKSASSEKVGPHFLRITDIQNGTVNWKNVPYCPILENDHLKYKLRDGDIVVARTGNSTGENYIFSGDYDAVFASYLIRFRIDESKSNPKYVWYTMRSSKWWEFVNGSKTGSAQAGANAKVLGRYPVPLPPLSEQKRIAHILGSLDDKIELNRQMNATLEGMAQALFKSWFVDFDPVIDNALAAGNPIPEAFAARGETRRKALADGTANRDVAKQFPAAFQFTEEMGWIPEGWEIGEINQLAMLNPESWNNKNHPQNIKYVDLANTKNGRINEIFPYVFSNAPSRARRVLREYDTIIGTVRPGNRSFAYIHKDGLTGSTGFAVLRPKKINSRSFIYLCLTQDEVIEKFAHLADGAAYPAIRSEVVGNQETIIFKSDLMTFFDQQCYPLFLNIGQHQQEVLTLTKLRDTLLPKLISGEVRIPEAEKLTEEALA